jgi:hypothetical protein
LYVEKNKEWARRTVFRHQDWTAKSKEHTACRLQIGLLRTMKSQNMYFVKI